MLLLDRFHFSRAIFMKLHLDCLDVKDNLQAVGCRLVDSELVRTTKPTKHSLFSCSFNPITYFALSIRDCKQEASCIFSLKSDGEGGGSDGGSSSGDGGGGCAYPCILAQPQLTGCSP